MATRSTIAIEFADGTVQQVYAHWDGYLEGNGAILEANYTDPFKVRDLIDLGDISSLGEQVGEKHPFGPFEVGMKSEDYDAQYGNMTTFYGRDRGETGTEARKFANVADYFENGQQEEYDYILRNVEGKATWFVRCYATDGAWTTIAEAKALQVNMEKEGAY